MSATPLTKMCLELEICVVSLQSAASAKGFELVKKLPIYAGVPSCSSSTGRVRSPMWEVLAYLRRTVLVACVQKWSIFKINVMVHGFSVIFFPVEKREESPETLL